MNNYWLDRKSTRLQVAAKFEETKHRLGRISTPVLWMSGRPLPVTHKLELVQNGKTVLPSHLVRMSVTGDTLVATFLDDGSFPLKTYEWLSYHCWGARPNPADLQATIRVSMFGKPLATEYAVFTLKGASFKDAFTDKHSVLIEFELKLKS